MKLIILGLLRKNSQLFPEMRSILNACFLIYFNFTHVMEVGAAAYAIEWRTLDLILSDPEFNSWLTIFLISRMVTRLHGDRSSKDN